MVLRYARSPRMVNTDERNNFWMQRKQLTQGICRTRGSGQQEDVRGARHDNQGFGANDPQRAGETQRSSLLAGRSVSGSSLPQQSGLRVSSRGFSRWVRSKRRSRTSRRNTASGREVSGDTGWHQESLSTRWSRSRSSWCPYNISSKKKEVDLPAERAQEPENPSPDAEQSVLRGAGDYNSAVPAGPARSTTAASCGQLPTPTASEANPNRNAIDVDALTRGGKGGKTRQGQRANKEDKPLCFECGKPGHYARDCWHRQGQGKGGKSNRQIKGDKKGRGAVNELTADAMTLGSSALSRGSVCHCQRGIRTTREDTSRWSRRMTTSWKADTSSRWPGPEPAQEQRTVTGLWCWRTTVRMSTCVGWRISAGYRWPRFGIGAFPLLMAVHWHTTEREGYLYALRRTAWTSKWRMWGSRSWAWADSAVGYLTDTRGMMRVGVSDSTTRQGRWRYNVWPIITRWNPGCNETGKRRIQRHW